MNPDYLNEWPESYPITLDAVRAHLYGRPRIGDPAVWRQCAEYFAGVGSEANHGICHWMNIKGFPDERDHSNCADLLRFFGIISGNRWTWIWPTYRDFAPRRAALCRTVAARLEELQLNPPADESIH